MYATHAIAASVQPLILQIGQLRSRKLGGFVQDLYSRSSKLEAELVRNPGFLSSGLEPFLLIELGILTSVARCGLKVTLPGFRSQLCHQLAMCPWLGDVTSLSHCCFICRIGDNNCAYLMGWLWSEIR